MASKRSDAVVATQPGGEIWKKASPDAQVIAGGLHSVSAALDELQLLSNAVDKLDADLPDMREIADAISDGFIALAKAIGDHE